MTILVDTHVHIYPFYHVEDALESILENLARHDSAAMRIACLTERYDCDLYNQLKTTPSTAVAERFSISDAGSSLRLQRKVDGKEFHLLPGQQVITAENIEVLALNCPHKVTEGLPAPETVQAILQNSGIPVAAWAPGKWFFHRGRVVAQLLAQFSPQQLALGDTSLRPYGWGTPSIIRAAQKRGYRVLYGSDPLPFVGEEVRPGSYLTKIDGAAVAGLDDPAAILGRILDPDISLRCAGVRGSLPQVLRRLYRNHRAPTPPRAITENTC